MTLNNDRVKITCYRSTEYMNRDDAIRFYMEGVRNCDGAERNRYMNILLDLLDGLNVATDER